MKKAITILMLALAIIAGGATAEAKTTKKANKTSVSSSSTFNLKTLTSKIYSKNSNVFQLSLSQLNSAMKELGFSRWGDPYSSTVYNDIDDSLDHVTGYGYSKGDIMAYAFIDDSGNLRKILIEFPSASKASAFVSSSKSALGSALKGSSSNYYYTKGYTVWAMIHSGATIEIILEEDMG